MEGRVRAKLEEKQAKKVAKNTTKKSLNLTRWWGAEKKS